MKSPEAYAFEITRTIQAAFGTKAYPLRISDVIDQFAPIHAAGVAVRVEHRPMNSIDGALIVSSDRNSYTVLVNRDIGSAGRKNFTLAHEFGHLLLHRQLRAEFWCGQGAVLGLTKDEVENQANRFASQILLPNNLVRATADSADLTLSDLKQLSNQTGASLSATALALVAMSGRPVGFVVVRDGFTRWGRSSESAYKSGLFFRGGDPVPENSAADFEGGDSDQTFSLGTAVTGWSKDDRWREQGFYSARYKEAYFLLTR